MNIYSNYNVGQVPSGIYLKVVLKMISANIRSSMQTRTRSV